MTEHELVPANVLVQALGGWGAQFNNHLYAPITPWPHGPSENDVETKVKALQPELVRIFYNDNWEENQNGTHPEWHENYASFVKVVRLAQETGATSTSAIRTSANARSHPSPDDGEVRRRVRTW